MGTGSTAMTRSMHISGGSGSHGGQNAYVYGSQHNDGGTTHLLTQPTQQQQQQRQSSNASGSSEDVDSTDMNTQNASDEIEVGGNSCDSSFTNSFQLQEINTHTNTNANANANQNNMSIIAVTPPKLHFGNKKIGVNLSKKDDFHTVMTGNDKIDKKNYNEPMPVKRHHT